MKEKNSVIEIIKNILIVVLLITSILLLSFFWQDINLSEIGSSLAGSVEEADSFAPDINTLVKPDQILVNMGNDLYTLRSSDDTVQGGSVNLKGIVSEDRLTAIVSAASGVDAVTDTSLYDTEGAVTLYTYALCLMERYMSTGNYMVEQIEESQFDEVMSYPSIVVDFGFELPIQDFATRNGLSEYRNNSDVRSMTGFGVSTASSDNLFLINEKDNSCWRLAIDDEEVAAIISESLASAVEGVESTGAVPYFTIENLTGAANDRLMPLYNDTVFSSLTWGESFNINDDQAVGRIENAFFPSGLDFVRKITENHGSLLYNYGYSEKVLLINQDSSLDYTEAVDPAVYEETGFYESLEAAVDYIRSHGGWSSLYNGNTAVRLINAEAEEYEGGRYKGYNFQFGLSTSGIAIESPDGNLLTIELCGVQVTHYLRDVVSVYGDGTTYYGQVTVPAIDMITDTYEEAFENLMSVSKHFKEANAEVTSNEARLEAIFKGITSIKLEYLRTTDEASQQVLKPVWAIDMGDAKFFADAFSGKYLSCRAE